MPSNINPTRVDGKAMCNLECSKSNSVTREPPSCAKATDYTDGLCAPYYFSSVPELERMLEDIDCWASSNILGQSSKEFKEGYESARSFARGLLTKYRAAPMYRGKSEQ